MAWNSTTNGWCKTGTRLENPPVGSATGLGVSCNFPQRSQASSGIGGTFSFFTVRECLEMGHYWLAVRINDRLVNMIKSKENRKKPQPENCYDRTLGLALYCSAAAPKTEPNFAMAFSSERTRFTISIWLCPCRPSSNLCVTVVTIATARLVVAELARRYRAWAPAGTSAAMAGWASCGLTVALFGHCFGHCFLWIQFFVV